jgi:hypothetical protein
MKILHLNGNASIHEAWEEKIAGFREFDILFSQDLNLVIELGEALIEFLKQVQSA